MQDREFILIAVPKKEKPNEYTRVKQACCERADLCVAYQFEVPALKIGTLDSLMALVDELARVDTIVEGTLRRLVSLRFSLVLPGLTDLEPLTVTDSVGLDSYCIKFRWFEAKYPSRTPLPSLVSIIQSAVAKVDEACRVRQQEWNSTAQAIAALVRKKSGSLRDKELNDSVVPKNMRIDSEYLQTLLVVVPLQQTKPFLATYESFAQFIVPRSALEITRDSEDVLYRVVMFRRATDDFRQKCRDARYIVRDYQPEDPAANGALLDTQAKQQVIQLRKSMRANFADVFIAWIHLKTIRAFVEAVLRFGPPASYEMMLLAPHKSEIKKLRTVLATLFAGLGGQMLEKEENDENADAAYGGNATFYPYVSIDLDLDLGTSTGGLA